MGRMKLREQMKMCPQGNKNTFCSLLSQRSGKIPDSGQREEKRTDQKRFFTGYFQTVKSFAGIFQGNMKILLVAEGDVFGPHVNFAKSLAGFQKSDFFQITITDQVQARFQVLPPGLITGLPEPGRREAKVLVKIFFHLSGFCVLQGRLSVGKNGNCEWRFHKIYRDVNIW